MRREGGGGDRLQLVRIDNLCDLAALQLDESQGVPAHLRMAQHAAGPQSVR